MKTTMYVHNVKTVLDAPSELMYCARSILWQVSSAIFPARRLAEAITENTDDPVLRIKLRELNELDRKVMSLGDELTRLRRLMDEVMGHFRDEARDFELTTNEELPADV